MPEVRRLKLIKGGKTIEDKYCFVNAIATKTRLMGVISLKLLWRSSLTKEYLAQWFTLDSEEHGIYDYVSVRTKSFAETDKYTQQFMGSLGGEIVSITEREAIFLINHYKRMNKLYNKEIPKELELKFIFDVALDLNEEEGLRLQDKIYEAIESPIQLINFFVMRLVAKDMEAMERYSSPELIAYLADLSLVNRASSLLKNSSAIVDRVDSRYVYSVRSLVDAQSEYFTLSFEIEVKRILNEFRISKGIFLGKEAVEPELVAEEIRTPEHIRLYKIISDEEKFLRTVEQHKGSLLEYQFLQGKMLVEFRSHNDHVKKQNYHIGGDIRAIYFINSYKEFIICYYDAEDFAAIYNDFLCFIDMRLELLMEETLNSSVIYQYAELQRLEFYDYLTQLLEDGSNE